MRAPLALDARLRVTESTRGFIEAGVGVETQLPSHRGIALQSRHQPRKVVHVQARTPRVARPALDREASSVSDAFRPRCHRTTRTGSATPAMRKKYRANASSSRLPASPTGGESPSLRRDSRSGEPRKIASDTSGRAQRLRARSAAAFDLRPRPASTAPNESPAEAALRPSLHSSSSR